MPRLIRAVTRVPRAGVSEDRRYVSYAHTPKRRADFEDYLNGFSRGLQHSQDAPELTKELLALSKARAAACGGGTR